MRRHTINMFFCGKVSIQIDNVNGYLPTEMHINQGSHELWKSWKTWKISKKSFMHGKIMEFEKNLNNHGKNHGICKNNLTKPPVARKLAVRHTRFVCLTASFQATGVFKF